MLLVKHLISERTEVYVLSSDCSIVDASNYLRENRIGGVPVVDDDVLVGFCSERDIVFRAISQGKDPHSTKVADIMTKDVVTAAPEDTVSDCEDKLRKAHCRHLPILDGKKIVACLSMRDFLQSELRECKLQVEQLTNYIQGSTLDRPL